MSYNCKDDRHFSTFLNKFKLLEEIQWNEEILRLALEHVCWDITGEQIDYIELKFSIDKYLKHNPDWTPEYVIDLIHQIMLEQAEKWNFMFGLVLSLKYESNRNNQRRYARTIDKCADLLVGLDLVGDELFFDSSFYEGIFREWHSANKGLEAHVGETQSAENVQYAIERLNVDRIAHGIKAAHNDDIMRMAIERDICFDVALSSNVYTGIIKDYPDHPIKSMIEKGCQITIGTDDPAILNTTLDKEYELLRQHHGLSDEQLIKIMFNSVKYAFTDLD
jgi:adenosine deaminase